MPAKGKHSCVLCGRRTDVLFGAQTTPPDGTLREVCQLCAVLEGIRGFSASWPEESNAHTSVVSSLEELFRYAAHWQGVGGTESEMQWAEWVDDFKRCSQSAVVQASMPTLPEQRLLQAEALVPHTYWESCVDATLLCGKPLMASFPNFASSEECAELIDLGIRVCRPHGDWAKERSKPGNHKGRQRGSACASLDPKGLEGRDRYLVECLQRRAAALTGIQEHPDELLPFLKFDVPSAGTSTDDDFDVGLHVDVNGGFWHRACTIILYLNACERGFTVFPCLGDEESQALGSQLTGGKRTHTRSSAVKSAGLENNAAQLIGRATSAPKAYRQQPRPGTALLFFNLLGTWDSCHENEHPAVDPWSWHGGGAVAGAVGKWSLQFFKEVPIDQRDGEKEASYIAKLRRRLQEAVVVEDAEPSFSEMD